MNKRNKLTVEYPQHPLHCDRCGRPLGTYLYGKGGIEEVAHLTSPKGVSGIPDMFCKDYDACEEYRMSYRGRLKL